ncbi:MAG TPA: hypothetical protein VKW09_09050 [bacterium]|nr:hypothetical protein [bacterium]
MNQSRRLEARHDRHGSRRDRVIVTLAAAAAIAFLAWTAGAVAPAAFGDEAPALTAVHDLGHVFSLSVPATWRTKVTKGDTALSAVSSAAGDGPPDTVEVVVRDTMVGINDAKSCEEKAKWVMRVWLHKQFTTLSEGPMTIGGLPSYAQTYTWTAAEGAQRWSTQACVVQQGKVYVLTGTTAYVPPAAPPRAGLIMTILNSFRFTTSASR